LKYVSEIWKNIIIPICRGWHDQDVFENFTHHAVVLKPHTFPEALLWSGFGLTYMLEKVHQTFEDQEYSEGEGYYLTELAAALERSLAFVYTGSARSLSRELLEPLWL
jgi:hypothetical protein